MIKHLARQAAKRLIAKIKVWPLRQVLETSSTAAPITIRTVILQKLFGFNRAAYWPTHFTSVISSPQNIEIGIGAAPGLSPNCYIQGMAGIKVGNYTLVAPGVGIISANHDIQNISGHKASRGVVIGDYCWIGMNSVILPEVRLGSHTIVAAGSVVTKSFCGGYCVLAGNPAKVIKYLDPMAVVGSHNRHEYIGYYKASFFLQNKKSILRLTYNQSIDSFNSDQ